MTSIFIRRRSAVVRRGSRTARRGPGRWWLKQNMALTNKQKVFVEEYLKDFNATRAALKAGYSEKTAYSIGWENLRKPEIKTEIEKRLADRTLTADEVLVRLGEQARADYSAYLTPRGVDLEGLLAAGKGHLIKSIKETKYGRVIEFYDAQAALVQIGRHHQLFTDGVANTGEFQLKVVYDNKRPDNQSETAPPETD